VGQGKEPVDMSEERGKHAFMQSMRKWADSLANNKDSSKFGYADIEDVEDTVDKTAA
jgi:hypothetical protein